MSSKWCLHNQLMPTKLFRQLHPPWPLKITRSMVYITNHGIQHETSAYHKLVINQDSTTVFSEEC